MIMIGSAGSISSLEFNVRYVEAVRRRGNRGLVGHGTFAVAGVVGTIQAGQAMPACDRQHGADRWWRWTGLTDVAVSPGKTVCDRPCLDEISHAHAERILRG